MKHNQFQHLEMLWRHHRQTNDKAQCDSYICDLLLELHDIDTLFRHAWTLEGVFRRLEKEWRRFHRYDYQWARKLARETGKPVAVFLNREIHEGAI